EDLVRALVRNSSAPGRARGGGRSRLVRGARRDREPVFVEHVAVGRYAGSVDVRICSGAAVRPRDDEIRSIKGGAWDGLAARLGRNLDRGRIEHRTVLRDTHSEDVSIRPRDEVVRPV